MLESSHTIYSVLLGICSLAVAVWSVGYVRRYFGSRALELVALPGDGSFALAVTVPGRHQHVLRALSGPGAVRHPCEVQLLPDHHNSFDDMAVEVRVDGEHVGWLSREDARAYRRKYADFGKVAGRCSAVLVGAAEENLAILIDLPV